MKEIKLENCPKEIQKQITSRDLPTRRKFSNECNVKYLSLLINDKDYWVKYYLIKRIDISYLPQMLNNTEYSHYTIGRIIAQRIDESYLLQMSLNNNDYLVECAILDRLGIIQMVSPDSECKKFVKDCDIKYLPYFINNKDIEVRLQVAKRIDKKYLFQMKDDSDSRVKYKIDKRINNEVKICQICNKK